MDHPREWEYRYARKDDGEQVDPRWPSKRFEGWQDPGILDSRLHNPARFTASDWPYAELQKESLLEDPATHNAWLTSGSQQASEHTHHN